MPVSLTMRIAPALVVGILASASCFSPKINEGVGCGEGDSCPAGMQCDPVDDICRFELLPQGDDLQIFPLAIDFGMVQQGSPSPISTITVLNSGLTTSKEIDVRLQGSDRFRITSNECQGITLGRGVSCVITGIFEPTEPVESEGTLTVTDTENTATSPVSGIGLAPGDLQVSPSNFDFAPQTVGVSITSTDFIVTNSGDDTTGRLSINTVNDASFQIVGDNCTDEMLQSQESCTLRVTFTPMLAGNSQSSLVISAMPGGAAPSQIRGLGTATISIAHTPSDKGMIGSVRSSPESFVCPSDCNPTFTVPDVTLTPSGFNGVRFDRWGATLPNNNPCGNMDVCDLKMDQAEHQVVAVWVDCLPNEFLRCEGDKTLIRCGSAATTDELEETCEFACSVNARDCTECDPGQPSCSEDDDGVVLFCGSDGFFTQMTENCTGGTSCIDGVCGGIEPPPPAT